MPPRPRITFMRLSSCGGCQLTLLNCEAELALLAEQVELIGFPLVSSAPDDGGPLDLALVEGSVMTPAQSEGLLTLRQRSTVLVAVGACALTGGIHCLHHPRATLFPRIYPATRDTHHPPLPVAALIAVDAELPGCPPEGSELLLTVATALQGALPALPTHAVCMECICREQRCLLREDHLPCLGPVTRAGCGALCPGVGVPCEGCRGRFIEANLAEMQKLLEIETSTAAAQSRLTRFGDACP